MDTMYKTGGVGGLGGGAEEATAAAAAADTKLLRGLEATASLFTAATLLSAKPFSFWNYNADIHMNTQPK